MKFAIILNLIILGTAHAQELDPAAAGAIHHIRLTGPGYAVPVYDLEEGCVKCTGNLIGYDIVTQQTRVRVPSTTGGHLCAERSELALAAWRSITIAGNGSLRSEEYQQCSRWVGLVCLGSEPRRRPAYTLTRVTGYQ